MMRTTVCCLVLVLAHRVAAFLSSPPATSRVQSTVDRASRIHLQSVANEAGRKPVTVTGNNIELTPALKEYTEKKIDKVLEKLGGMVTKVDVHLVVNRNPRVEKSDIAEVTVFAKGTVIRATESDASMYASIDLVADTIARKLRKYKDRNVSSKRHRPSVSETTAAQDAKFEEAQSSAVANGESAAASSPENDYINDDGLPHADMSIVKTKSFPMTPCSVEDAVIALDYIGHPFYVFRNAETNEVNVVYKRNSGGVGHIQPERD